MKPGEYQHFGMEFWSEHSAFGNPEFPDDFERALLVAGLTEKQLARIRSSRFPDDKAIEIGMWLTSGFAHVAMLHAAGTKAGLLVNGRTHAPMEGYSGKDAYHYGYNPIEGRDAIRALEKQK
ncbi:hypothetical protein CK227_20550 [Mesorhizobium sp. WSM4308]|nr:hypothetical protein CK227_20550 [Mesorhizobium sp. WSM4308]